jgi:hypothetical protein
VLLGQRLRCEVRSAVLLRDKACAVERRAFRTWRLRREAPCFYVIKSAPLETQINPSSEDCTAFSGLNENENSGFYFMIKGRLSGSFAIQASHSKNAK